MENSCLHTTQVPPLTNKAGLFGPSSHRPIDISMQLQDLGWVSQSRPAGSSTERLVYLCFQWLTDNCTYCLHSSPSLRIQQKVHFM